MHEKDAFVRGTACIFRYIDQIIIIDKKAGDAHRVN